MSDEDINITINESEEDINVTINESEDVSIDIDGVINNENFVYLLDTPNSYTGNANSYVRVKSDESGLEFVGESIAVDWGEIGGTLSDQTDLQNELDLKYDAADYNGDFDTRLATKDTNDLTEGTNLYYTDERSQDAVGTILSNEFTYDDSTPGISLNYTNISHIDIQDIGTNTHAQIDTHISDGTIHFEQSDISITENQISNLDKYTQLEVDNLLNTKEDNSKLLLGTGQDASIYYDGTDLIINPAEVGAGILDVQGTLQTDGYNSSDGSEGITTTFVDGDGNTIGVKNGLIVSKTAP